MARLCQHAGAGIQALSVIPDVSYRPSDLLGGAATFRPVAGPSVPVSLGEMLRAVDPHPQDPLVAAGAADAEAARFDRC